MKLAENIISRRGILSRFASVPLAAILLASCANEKIDCPEDVDSDAGYITLSLSSDRLGSRATEEGYNSLNENDIDHALICLFPADETGNALFYKDVVINRESNATVKLKINRDIVSQLFQDGATTGARVYVIANLPETSVLPAEMTLDNLRKIAITSPFASSAPQSSFVMDGVSDVNLEYDATNPSLSSVSGEVSLTRSAAKITLGVSMAATVTDGNGDTWESKPGEMTVIISDGVNTSQVVPSTYTVTESDYYSTSSGAEDDDERARSFTSAPAGSEYPHELASPFYTYPNSWTSSVSNESEHMTYMTLMVPWKKETEDRYRTCYYTVPVLRKASDEGIFELVRNVSYRVNIKVNILGSFTPDEPLELTDCSYRAVEWGQEAMNVEVGDYRYLVLDTESYVANNEALVNIPFYSSHETVITDTQVKYYLYNTTAAGLEQAVDITAVQNERSTTTIDGVTKHIYSSSIDNEINPATNSRTLIFDHDLYQWNPQNSNGGAVNLGATTVGGTSYPTTTLQSRLNQIYRYVRTNNIPFSRYDVVITFIHKDKIGAPDAANFTRTVKITQYPPMYIEADANNFVWQTNNNVTQPWGNAAYGSTYINGTTRTGTGNESNDMIPNGLIGGNRNPNMYIVSISQLGIDSKRYIIGDPRTTGVDNLTGNGWNANSWANAPYIGRTGNDTRRLSYYHPTDGSTAKQFYVAPKIRIASSYGVSYAMSNTVAKRRCAGYQEKDCPAGRWRLPTYGELEFIINLSNQGKIPVLFTSTSNYMTAQGAVSGSVTNGQLGTVNATGNANVRCVYDEWSWEGSKVTSSGTVAFQNTTVPSYPFTWGDKQ